MEDGDQGSQLSCFQRWMNLQEQDISELIQALNLNNDANIDEDQTSNLIQLINKNITHFHEYATQRASLAHENVFSYFSPTWCTSVEGSMLWAGGCRPSIFIRLVFALSGYEIVSHLDEFLNGDGVCGLGELSANQIRGINSLQMKTIREEDKLSRDLASLQEEIADEPIAIIAKESISVHGEHSGPANEALNGHAISMRNVLKKADELRLNTMKELIGILTPIQAVDYLAVSKKLHLCLHGWGKRRDTGKILKNHASKQE